MIQRLFAASLLVSLTACGSAPTSAHEASGEPGANESASAASADSIYALSSTTLAGEPADLSGYQGKVTVFVNVASQCGYTRQYEGLQQLHEELGGQGFAIVGIPSNDFGGQEPGTAEQIQAFCADTYGVTFDMLSKQGTKDGNSPIFDRLAELTGERPQWNFCKYVVSPDGRSARFFPSRVEPGAAELRQAIDELGS